MKVKSKSGVAQLCPTPSDPMDCSLPGSSVHGIHKACGAANDSCSQEGSWGGYCRNEFQTQPTQGANCDRWISSNPLWKIKKKKKVLEKMFSIPNYYRRKDNQNDSMKPNPTSKNWHTQKSTNSKCGREPGADWTSIQGWWEWTLRTASTCQNINISRELIVVSNIHTWAHIPRNPSFKKTHAPQ